MGLGKYTHPKYYAKRAVNWERHEAAAKREGINALAAIVGCILVVGAVIFAVMWPLSLLGHALHLTPSWHQLMHRHHGWEHQHYPLVGLRYLAVAGILIGATAGSIAVAVRVGSGRAA